MRDAIEAVLAEIRATPNCEVLPPAGQPALPDGLALPDDLATFFELCGGAWLFESEEAEWRVCGPEDFVPAAPRLVTDEIAAEVARDEPDHVVNACFVFADNGEGSTDEHVVVDLHPARRGRYYETFWDRFGTPGEMPIIAVSVADALRWLLASEGEGAEAALERVPVLGDAFETDHIP